jgi:hypothetical protein
MFEMVENPFREKSLFQIEYLSDICNVLEDKNSAAVNKIKVNCEHPVPRAQGRNSDKV